ncbi:MAG TPA: acyl-CoA dehydrogenase N-terminal domain-containing protein, partial [Gammaproteobacteria bacterium]|nr:acyl-CoA dehydrogenase N-terminal domain-containing protein [Gammaproteobacteria bacterium]HJP41977.1 acyl-CoA dehydrogenase N-terminal domain-containing protein [Gammaproteobacteria bacterium]
MSQYQAPIKDMLFVLDQLIGLDNITKLDGCEDINIDFVESVLTGAAEIATEVIAPTNVDGDRYGVSLKNGIVEVPPGYQEAYDKYIQGGWSGLGFKPEFGGQGLPSTIAIPVNEIVMAANFSW